MQVSCCTIFPALSGHFCILLQTLERFSSFGSFHRPPFFQGERLFSTRPGNLHKIPYICRFAYRASKHAARWSPPQKDALWLHRRAFLLFRPCTGRPSVFQSMPGTETVLPASARQTIFSGRTVSSNSSAVSRPRASTASFSVVPSARAFFAHLAAAS